MKRISAIFLLAFCVLVCIAQNPNSVRAKQQKKTNQAKQLQYSQKQLDKIVQQQTNQTTVLTAHTALGSQIKSTRIKTKTLVLGDLLLSKHAQPLRCEQMKNRFLSYVSIESQSIDEPDMNSFPISEGQKSLARHIYKEVKAFSKGETKVTLSDDHYVYIDIPSNTRKEVPSVLFMAHLDVTPEAPGVGIKPIVHSNYDGGDIVLPGEITLSPNTPQGVHLKDLVGKTIVTSDGTTLLGADDKTGCAILVTLAQYLTLLKKKHGRVMIVLSQNEDVGKAALRYDPSVFGCRPDIVIDFDGSTYDKFSIANFTAIGQTYYFKGNKAHPSNGKANKYADALTAACHFVGLIPPQLSPSATEGQEGYVHCYSLAHPQDSLGKVVDDDYVVKVRLRYFDQNDGANQKQLLTDNMQKTQEAFPFVDIKKTDDQMQYENIAYTMPEYVSDIISRSAKSVGMEMAPRYSRAGTTSAMMVARFPDLMPGGCDVYSGQNAVHSCYEWACIEELVQLTDMALYMVYDIANNK